VRIRRALNVESGLNVGIATPFVTVFLALLGAVSDALVEVATWTILISVVAHGATAGPLWVSESSAPPA
jgi:NhaP-type Na+/H+ or K+/H+ antiporter